MIKKSLISLLLLFMLLPVNVSANAQISSSDTILTTSTASNEISPYSDIIEWRYKMINNTLHKRLFNCTKQVWVGNWIRC